MRARVRASATGGVLCSLSSYVALYLCRSRAQHTHTRRHQQQCGADGDGGAVASAIAISLCSSLSRARIYISIYPECILYCIIDKKKKVGTGELIVAENCHREARECKHKKSSAGVQSTLQLYTAHVHTYAAVYIYAPFASTLFFSSQR